MTCSRLTLRPLRSESRISEARSDTVSIAVVACGNSSSTVTSRGYSIAASQPASRDDEVAIAAMAPLAPVPAAATAPALGGREPLQGRHRLRRVALQHVDPDRPAVLGEALDLGRSRIMKPCSAGSLGPRPVQPADEHADAQFVDLVRRSSISMRGFVAALRFGGL